MQPELPTSDFFPALNASLNFVAALFLGRGFYLIKRGRREAHKRAMLFASLVSALFLVSYLWYHTHYRSQVYHGPAAWKPLYYILLASHVILATLVAPAAVALLYWAYREAWAQHRRWGKIVWPIWMYVSVTGVVVYLILYRVRL